MSSPIGKDNIKNLSSSFDSVDSFKSDDSVEAEELRSQKVYQPFEFEKIADTGKKKVYVNLDKMEKEIAVKKISSMDDISKNETSVIERQLINQQFLEPVVQFKPESSSQSTSTQYKSSKKGVFGGLKSILRKEPRNVGEIDLAPMNDAVKVAREARNDMDQDLYDASKVTDEQRANTVSKTRQKIVGARVEALAQFNQANKLCKKFLPKEVKEYLKFLYEGISNIIKLYMMDLSLFDAENVNVINKAQSSDDQKMIELSAQERQELINEIKSRVVNNLSNFRADLLQSLADIKSEELLQRLQSAYKEKFDENQGDVNDRQRGVKNKREYLKNAPILVKANNVLRKAKVIYLASFSLSSIKYSDKSDRHIIKKLENIDSNQSVEFLIAKLKHAVKSKDKTIAMLEKEIAMHSKVIAKAIANADDNTADNANAYKKIDQVKKLIGEEELAEIQIFITKEEKDILDAVISGNISISSYASTSRQDDNDRVDDNSE